MSAALANGSKARVVTRNVGWNFAAQIWLLGLAVVTTPFIVYELGTNGYGLFTLVVTIVGYFALLDLGLGTATVKYLAEFHGQGDKGAVQRLVGTAMGAYLVLGAVGGAAIALLSSFLVHRVLDVPGDLASDARLALLVAAAGFLVTMPLSVLSAIPNGLQRMDLTNRRNIAFGTTTLVGTVLLLAIGYGLVAVLLFTVAVSVAASISFLALTRRLLPWLSLRPGLDREMLGLLLRFGSLKFTNQVSTQTVLHLDKFLVGALASLGAVTFYAIPVLVAQRLASLVANVAIAFLPAASELHGLRDRARFEELYFRATKLVALLVFPVGAALVVFAEPLLRFWLGQEFAEESAGVLRVLALGYVLNALSTIPAVASDSVGRPGVTATFSVASAVLNVVLSVALIPPFGILGASFAILVNSIVLVPVFVLYVQRSILGLGLADLARRSLLRPALATGLSLVPMLALLALADSLPLLLLALAGSGAAYLGLTFAVSVYDPTDRQLARSFFARVATEAP